MEKGEYKPRTYRKRRKGESAVRQETLIQTIVDKALAQKIRFAAQHEGISVAAYVRRMLIEWGRST